MTVFAVPCAFVVSAQTWAFSKPFLGLALGYGENRVPKLPHARPLKVPHTISQPCKSAAHLNRRLDWIASKILKTGLLG